MRIPLLVFISTLFFLAVACDPAPTPTTVEVDLAEAGVAAAHEPPRQQPETVTSSVEKSRDRSEAPRVPAATAEDRQQENPAGLAEIAIFRKVDKKKLPATLLGLPRTEKREEDQPDDYASSTYRATYADGHSRVRVTLVDAPGQLDAAMIRARWTITEPADSAADYSRIIDLHGHAAYETFQAAQDRRTLTLLVDDRYLINVEAYGLEAEAVREAGVQLGF